MIKVEKDLLINTFIEIMKSSIKGISQVILIENIFTGLIILSAITIFNYQLGIMALLSSIIGTLIGYFGGANKAIVTSGQFGFNCVLIGLSLSLFLVGNVRYIIAIAGVIITAVFTATTMYFLKKYAIPVLTFPYVILTWLFLLATYHLKMFELSPELIPQKLSYWSQDPKGTVNILQAIINGIGQVYFSQNLWIGILIFIGILIGNWKAGLFALLGTTIGFATAYLLGSENTLINLGLYGYNSVLTILAITLVFNEKSRLSFISGCIAAMLAVPITAGIHTVLLLFGLPTLTMPFVIITWIYIGAKKVLPNLW